jgi:2-amino-4-hydroxy-6-hydroxymethyldihydropteridine diphosphokinase
VTIPLRDRAWIGVGANLGDRLATMRSAVAMIETEIADTTLVATSPVYETRPLGPSIEPFLNAAIEVVTGRTPRQLLERLHEIERAHRRERRIRWEARTLDLDLVAFRHEGEGDIVHEDDGTLVLPHPRAHLRDFVLQPLVDLGAAFVLWDGRTPEELLAALSEEERTILRRVADGL